MSRRPLPLNAVDAFIVTARHLNLTRAAKELCLTQSAVSRKIAALEAWFGFPLFERHARGLHLSPQGSALLPELRNAFHQLVNCAEQARGQQSVVRLKAPTCAMRWLVPKLMQLEAREPELQVALTTTTDHDINFKSEPFDAAIVFGTTHSGEKLFDEALTPVLSAALLPPDFSLSVPGNLTFLHPTRDTTDWTLWFDGSQIPCPVMRRSQHFDTMDLAISAAIQGFGIAIADEQLVADDLRTGRLVRPFPGSVKTGASYRLVQRDGGPHAAAAQRFCETLLSLS